MAYKCSTYTRKQLHYPLQISVSKLHTNIFFRFESICVHYLHPNNMVSSELFALQRNLPLEKICCIHCFDDFSGLDFSSFISTGNMCNLCQWKRKLSPQNNKKISLLLMKTRNLKMKKRALKSFSVNTRVKRKSTSNEFEILT